MNLNGRGGGGGPCARISGAVNDAGSGARVRRDTLQLQKGEGGICILGGDWPRARQLMHLYRPPLLSFPIMPLSQCAAQSIKYSSEK